MAAAALTSDLIHDLQQPLSGILALTDPGGCPGVDAGRLQQVHDLAAWMQQLLGSASDSSATKAHPGRLVTNVREICRSVAAGSDPSGSIVTFVGPEAPAFVALGQVDLRRIVGNVIDNAVRAAGSQGHVRVDIGVERTRVVVAVADDGPGFGGIPSHTGRGLAIVRELATRHGGDVQIIDDRHGGVRVIISLPGVSPRHSQRAP
jgi:signal transduction histidine kinase